MKKLILLSLLTLSVLSVMSVPAQAQSKEEVLRLQSDINMLREEIRGITGDDVAKEIRSIPTKTTVSDEELRRIKAVQENFSRESRANITKDGWIVIPYGEIPTLNCSVNGFCVVQLEAGERSTDIKMSDEPAWDAGSASFGPDGLIESVWLKPFQSDSYSQLLVFTDKGRVYELFLDSTTVAARGDGSIPIHSMKVRYNYPDNSSINTNKIKRNQDESINKAIALQMRKMANTKANTKANGSLGFNERNGGESEQKNHDYETNYRISYIGGRKGNHNPDWKPVRVYADHNNNFTYLELPRKASEMPSVFVKGIDGKNEVVAAQVEGKYGNIIRIEGIHDRVVMKEMDGGMKKKYITAYEAVRL